MGVVAEGFLLLASELLTECRRWSVRPSQPEGWQQWQRAYCVYIDIVTPQRAHVVSTHRQRELNKPAVPKRRLAPDSASAHEVRLSSHANAVSGWVESFAVCA